MSVSGENPWDQLEKEPQKWFDRFETYRLQGPTRSLESVWRLEATIGKTKRPGPHWYAAKERYKWDERCRAWDDAERPRRRAEKIKMIKEMQERHANYGRLLMAKGLNQVKEIQLGDLDPGQALTYVLKGGDMVEKSLVGPLTVDLQERLDELKTQMAEILKGQPVSHLGHPRPASETLNRSPTGQPLVCNLVGFFRRCLFSWGPPLRTSSGRPVPFATGPCRGRASW